MNSGLHIVPFLLGLDHGLQQRLCERCLAQLAESRAQAPPVNVQFAGPVLVRSEAGYQVLSLPHRAKVIVGDASKNDCREFAAAVRAEVPSREAGENDWLVELSGNDEIFSDLKKLPEFVRALANDADEMVRGLAPRLWLVCATRCQAAGQFGQAIDACRQAILAGPEDEQCQNFLAWVRATCPDEAIRDGKEAVAAASKACALTQWKDGNCLDTLAAAWAEAGDFKRAVKFEERALRAGQLTDSERKERQERLALYRRSEPFREKH